MKTHNLSYCFPSHLLAHTAAYGPNTRLECVFKSVLWDLKAQAEQNFYQFSSFEMSSCSRVLIQCTSLRYFLARNQIKDRGAT